MAPWSTSEASGTGGCSTAAARSCDGACVIDIECELGMRERVL